MAASNAPVAHDTGRKPSEMTIGSKEEVEGRELVMVLVESVKDTC